MSNKTVQQPGKRQAHRPAGKPVTLPIVIGLAALVLIAAGIVVTTRGAGGSPPQAASAPRLTVDRETIDFGKVPLDVPVKAVFVLSNTGGRPLNILGEPVIEVKQGC